MEPEVEEKVDIKEEAFNELDEIEKKQWAPCDSCFSKYLKSVSSAFTFALFLCFNCGLYFCERCFKKHGKRGWKWFRISKNKSHKCVKKDGSEEERNEIIKGMVRKLMNEKTRRKKIVNNEKVRVYEIIFTNHKLDRMDCKITGLCVTENWRLVVCDLSNSCIKIFKLGSTSLKRYIRIGDEHFGPYDVTEIIIKRNSTVLDSLSSSGSVRSKTNHKKASDKYYICVTFPTKREIVFIDVFKKPATIVKTKNMGVQCYNIEYVDEKIYLCAGDPSLSVGPWSVHIMSTDGIELSVTTAGLYRYTPQLAVITGRIYLTDWLNDKVTCINDDSGRVISQTTLPKKSFPKGIGVDPGGNVYICAWQPHDNVYKLSFDLEGSLRPLLDRKKVCMERPYALCFHSDKLFVSHYRGLLENFVSVVKL